MSYIYIYFSVAYATEDNNALLRYYLRLGGRVDCHVLGAAALRAQSYHTVPQWLWGVVQLL